MKNIREELQAAAPFSPMGWNSWDCFGASVTEAELLENAEYMAQHLKKYGWDMWYAISNGMSRRQTLQAIINSPDYAWMNIPGCSRR